MFHASTLSAPVRISLCREIITTLLFRKQDAEPYVVHSRIFAPLRSRRSFNAVLLEKDEKTTKKKKQQNGILIRNNALATRVRIHILWSSIPWFTTPVRERFSAVYRVRIISVFPFATRKTLFFFVKFVGFRLKKVLRVKSLRRWIYLNKEQTAISCMV